MIEGDRHWIYVECVGCESKISFRELEIVWDEDAVQDIEEIVDAIREQICPNCGDVLYRGAVKSYPDNEGLKLPDLRGYPIEYGDVFTLEQGEDKALFKLGKNQ